MGTKGTIILSIVVWSYAIFFHPKNVTATVAKEFTGAGCGDVVEQFISTEDSVELSTAHLLTSDGVIPAGCDITWRIDMQIQSSLGSQNYGLDITGNLDLEDKQNGVTCASSKLLMTDADDEEEEDKSSVKQSVCGQKQIHFVTYEDVVTITLSVSKSGAQGSGFSITIKPFFACGGYIKGEAGSEIALTSPIYPLAYPKHIFCNWFVNPSGWEATLSCPVFDLPKKQRRKCKQDLLKVQARGRNKAYCAKDLQGDSKKLTLGSTPGAIKFQSDGKSSGNVGFSCKVTFSGP